MAVGWLGSAIAIARKSMLERWRIASKIDPYQQNRPRCAIMTALLSRAA
jgi:hypothetical protein